ncbi:MAG: winged helix-turn-helix transcriptional regulator [Schwartzia sp.]|nr:winged helix-turn-helix transcriptional regulator [Schwartzia sp. (in: firmicutes)]
MDDSKGRNLADLFKMLGDTTRIKLLGKIAAGEMRVGDIADSLGMQPSAISHQLRVLRSARIVTCRRDGKEAWYSLDDDHVVKLMRLGLEHVCHG